MPIRPENRARYPRNWRGIRRAILLEAGFRCECTGLCGLHVGERCSEIHGRSAGFAQGKIVLTVAHLDHTPENCARENLRALCQSCHLRFDRELHAQTRAATLAAKRGAHG